jgi:hypothetical protein
MVPLAGENVLGVHRVDDHGDIGLEDQQPAIRRLGAVDLELVETDPLKSARI